MAFCAILHSFRPDLMYVFYTLMTILSLSPWFAPFMGVIITPIFLQ